MRKNYMIKINNIEYYLWINQAIAISTSMYKVHQGSKLIKKCWLCGSDHDALINCINAAIETICGSSIVLNNIDCDDLLGTGCTFGEGWTIIEIDDVIYNFMTSAE